MRRVTAVLSAMAMATVMTAGLSAQAKPNFAGKWAMDQEKTTAANPAAPAGGGGGGGRGGGGRGGGGMGGGAIELKQDANTLTSTRQGPNGPTDTVYTLDGASHDVPMGQSTAKVTAKVDGATISIEQTVDRGNGPQTTHIVYSMDGDWLVITTTSPPRGGAGDPTVRKVYYKKAM